MKITRLEKMFVNRRQEAERNIGRVRRDLEQLDVDAIHDVSKSAVASELYRHFSPTVMG